MNYKEIAEKLLSNKKFGTNVIHDVETLANLFQAIKNETLKTCSNIARSKKVEELGLMDEYANSIIDKIIKDIENKINL